MVTVLFAGPDKDWAVYEEPLKDSLKELDCQLTRDPCEPEAINYVIYAPTGPINDFSPFTELRAILSLWAGVERIITNPTIKVPLTKMSEPGLKQGMAEYVTGHALRMHLEMDKFKQDGVWRQNQPPPLADTRRVGILGLGELGRAAATMCQAVGFQVLAWSNSPREMPGVKCFHGSEQIEDILSSSDILVTLLPLTSETTHILNKDTIALLPRGAAIINPGRGPLIDENALKAALDSGHLSHATLDVFAKEPLPVEHAFWDHEKVTVTPHIAAKTRPSSAAKVIAENIRRDLAGEPLLHLVNRDAGY